MLLSYITLGAFVFIFLEAASELDERQRKLEAIISIYRLVINETVAICSSGTRVDAYTVCATQIFAFFSLSIENIKRDIIIKRDPNFPIDRFESFSLFKVERRILPLLRVLSRTHEYDERFTPDVQMWTDSEEELHTK